MSKRKKITVVFFPKKSKSGTKAYNTYCRVTYDQRTTNFAVKFSFSAESLEDAQKKIDFMVLNKGALPNLKLRKRQIEKLIEFETNRFQDNYTIKGFGKRASFYLFELDRALTRILFSSMLTSLEDILTYRNFIKFRDIIQNNQSGSFFNIYDFLKDLNNEFKLDINELITQEFYNQITAIGLLNCFNYNKAQKSEEERINETGKVTTITNTITGETKEWRLIDRVPPRQWIHGFVEIGEWFLDSNDYKTSFKNFLKQDDAFELLDSYSSGGFSWLNSMINDSLTKFNPDISIGIIDKIIDNELVKIVE